jgi:hypothetical protein
MEVRLEFDIAVHNFHVARERAERVSAALLKMACIAARSQRREDNDSPASFEEE